MPNDEDCRLVVEALLTAVAIDGSRVGVVEREAKPARCLLPVGEESRARRTENASCRLRLLDQDVSFRTQASLIFTIENWCNLNKCLLCCHTGVLVIGLLRRGFIPM